MIAKELRDGWWKFAIGALLILLPAFALMSYEKVKEQANRDLTYSVITIDGSVAKPSVPPPAPEGLQLTRGPVEAALSEIQFSYGLSGTWLTMFLATIVGFSLVSGEVSRGSIFLLLSEPVSRTRVLLTKYGVAAGGLLAVAVLGAFGLILSASLKGYQLGTLSVMGFVLSVVLLWVGSLSALGLAILASVVFRDVVASAIATPLLLTLVLLGPSLGVSYLSQLRSVEISGQLSENLLLPLYWASESLFMGDSLALTNFLVCTIAAVVPLLAALWLFNRKAY